MKAIIPVAGVGTRLRPHTYTQPKPLMPVAGKPILGFIVDKLISVGFTDFVFIIGYLGEKIESYISKRYPNINAEFVFQQSREGLGHAVWLTRKLIDSNQEIFIALGDTIFEADLDEVLKSKTSVLGVKKVDDPRNFGVAEFDKDDYITRVIEKPEIPKSNMALVGLYKIRESTALMDALDELIKSEERNMGEFHLTDGIMKMIDKGVRFRSFKVLNWYDCGRKEILLETNATLLKKLNSELATADFSNCENTILVQPVSIAKGARVADSIIGPNVTIGENAVINRSIIKDSIIGNYTQLKDVVLEQSVIGADTTIKGNRQSLNIGDNTEIELR